MEFSWEFHGNRGGEIWVWYFFDKFLVFFDKILIFLYFLMRFWYFLNDILVFFDEILVFWGGNFGEILIYFGVRLPKTHQASSGENRDGWVVPPPHFQEMSRNCLKYSYFQLIMYL